MRKKAWVVIFLAVAVIAVCLGFTFTHQQRQVQKVGQQAEHAGLNVHKSDHHANKSNSGTEQVNTNNYSSDQWMLMGYMAYARDNYKESRHIQNTTDLVNDVQEDLDDGALKAEKTGQTTYSLTNKFGSVDVTVENTDVKVTGDGTTVNTKTNLKNTFGSYANQIKKMTQDITGNSGGQATKGNNKENPNFNNDEIAVATCIDTSRGTSIQNKIDDFKNTLQKDQNASIKDFPSDNYLSGIYHEKGALSIAFSFSTSAYTNYYVNDNNDQIKIKEGGPGAENVPATYKSKQAIIKKYSPYKSDVDQILQGIEYNRRQMPRLNKELYHTK